MKMTSWDIIRKPIITEKSMNEMNAVEYEVVVSRNANNPVTKTVTSKRKYTFVVDVRADKTMIKNAVEEVFGVKVESVNTQNRLGHNKRVGVHMGKKADTKKAVVTLTEDSKSIEFFENMN